MKLSKQKMQHLSPIFRHTFLKSCIKQPDLQLILENAQIQELQMDKVLFSAGDQIDRYFFLLKGVVCFYKNGTKVEQGNGELSENDFVEAIEGVRVIGEYFNSLHTIREFTAVAKLENTQIVKIEKKIFDSYCQSLILMYEQAEKYAKNVLKVSKKANCFQILNVKSYRLGSQIKLIGEVGVIMSGECKVLILIKKKNENDKSPIKFNLPSIVQQRQPIIKKEISIVTQNQWIFTENLQEENSEQFIFKYLVSSESLTLLTLAVENIEILPQSKINMLIKTHHQRKQRSFQQRSSFRPEMDREASSPPRVFKQKLNQAHKILENLDPNLSPTMLLKQYKLGYNPIRYEGLQRKERNSMASEIQILRRQNTERKVKKYYKAKDWSKYVKLPHSQV